MTNYERIKRMSIEKMAAEFMIFRPSDACFEDEHRNYCSLNNQFHKHSQDCFKANVEWLEAETGNDAEEYDKGLIVELPCKPLPMLMNSDNSDAYCPFCGENLSGYYGDYNAPDILPCFNCGEWLDNTKSMSIEEAGKALKNKL